MKKGNDKNLPNSINQLQKLGKSLNNIDCTFWCKALATAKLVTQPIVKPKMLTFLKLSDFDNNRTSSDKWGEIVEIAKFNKFDFRLK